MSPRRSSRLREKSRIGKTAPTEPTVRRPPPRYKIPVTLRLEFPSIQAAHGRSVFKNVIVESDVPLSYEEVYRGLVKMTGKGNIWVWRGLQHDRGNMKTGYQYEASNYVQLPARIRFNKPMKDAMMMSQVIRQRTGLPNVGRWASQKFIDETYTGRGGGRQSRRRSRQLKSRRQSRRRSRPKSRRRSQR